MSKLKKTTTIFLLLIVIFLVGYFLYDRYLTDVKSNVNDSNKKDNQEVKEKEPVESTISLIMAGDALIHGSVYKDAALSDNTYDFSSMFDNVRDLIGSHDLAFYNQETILGGTELGLSDYPRFNTPQEFGDNMIDLGFNIVAQANNHSLDRGEQAIINSVNYWKEKEVLTAGTYLSEEERLEERIKEKDGITYTLLSYTTLTNGLIAPAGKEYLVNVYNEEQVKSDVERLRNKVDLLIVSMHWGVEYTNTPTNQQKEIANYLSTLGVDIVIGHHPHVIQPIEYVNGTLVFYSLGNLISAQIGSDKLTGMLCSLDITKREEEGNTSISFSEIRANLIYTYYYNWRNFKIIPYSQMSSNYLNNYEEVYNKYVGIVTSLDETVTVGQLNND